MVPLLGSLLPLLTGFIHAFLAPIFRLQRIFLLLGILQAATTEGTFVPAPDISCDEATTSCWNTARVACEKIGAGLPVVRGDKKAEALERLLLGTGKGLIFVDIDCTEGGLPRWATGEEVEGVIADACPTTTPVLQVFTRTITLRPSPSWTVHAMCEHKEKGSSPWRMAAWVGGSVVLCAAVVVFAVYIFMRWRKKSRGSFDITMRELEVKEEA